MTAIRVAHPGADYEVVVGGLADNLDRLVELTGRAGLPLVTDEKVHRLFGHLLDGIALADPILVPDGEAAKDWATLATIIERLAALDIKRGTPIIALGGGSVGDVAGLAASIFKRGCPIIHLPTTLLAQADSAIGGKTAIDAGGQKNLAGTFHHPWLVIADPALLDTLDDRQLRSGYAEVFKYGLIDDPDFFAWCEGHSAALLAGDRAARCAAIEHCIKAKARFVRADPADTSGTRALLNFGHTFGHAIESLSPTLHHGEAVAIGMVLAMNFSAKLGLCDPADAQRVRHHVASAGLPTSLSEGGLAGRSAELLALMAQDKKADKAGIALVLTRGIGQAMLVKGVETARLASFLQISG